MDWIYVAQDRDRWRVLVNAVMNLRVLQMRGISWVAGDMLAIQGQGWVESESKYARLH
jgi:hypothetical protein